MPAPKNYPKYLPAFCEFAAAHSHKRAVKDTCIAFPGLLEKHWAAFKEQQDAEAEAKPKKAKKEVPESKKVESAVKNLSKVFADVSPENQHELVQQMQHAMGVQIASGDAAPEGSEPSDDARASVQSTINNLSSHLETAKETLDNVQKIATEENNPSAQPLIDTTTNFIRVVQQGMDDISQSLHLQGSSRKRKRDSEDAEAEKSEEDEAEKSEEDE